MAWSFSNPEQTVQANLVADSEHGNLNGNLTFFGQSFAVGGGWSAAGAVTPERRYTVFSLSGIQPALPQLQISASGVIFGSGDQPTSIVIDLSVASSADGTLSDYSTVLYNDGALDGFDHVVVLMLENRSFDNLLGFLYPQGPPSTAPLGQTFEGVTGKGLTNPVPTGVPNRPRVPPPIPVSAVPPGDNGLKANYFQPYPDPGETYDHVARQIFWKPRQGTDPYNVPLKRPLPTPTMQGFAEDFFRNYEVELPGQVPTYDQYEQIMQCYTPDQVPVVSTLAEQFGVFDHWFCAVPSQTWCNRAFWNAGTSWGHVNNGGSLSEGLPWIPENAGPTVFTQIQLSHSQIPGSPGLNWMVYADSGTSTWNPIAPLFSLTHLVHSMNLDPYWGPFNFFYHFDDISQFFVACANNNLPAYSFIEPRFFKPSNDMHPSSANSKLFGKGDVGSVLLGEHLVWRVYDAIRNSPAFDRTLLIITFDEHGGCYDHVPPPNSVTPPDLTAYLKEDNFPFDRLGVRVPTIMVSSRITKNTVVNTPMHHGSFMKTLAKKWEKIAPGHFAPLTARVADAPEFTQVFTSPTARPRADWPVIAEPVIPPEFYHGFFLRTPRRPRKVHRPRRGRPSPCTRGQGDGRSARPGDHKHGW